MGCASSDTVLFGLGAWLAVRSLCLGGITLAERLTDDGSGRFENVSTGVGLNTPLTG